MNKEQEIIEKTEPFHFLDIFNYEKMFSLMEIQNDGDMTYWIWVALFYIVLLLPCWILVRASLFLILPKSWLKKMFDI